MQSSKKLMTNERFGSIQMIRHDVFFRLVLCPQLSLSVKHIKHLFRNKVSFYFYPLDFIILTIKRPGDGEYERQTDCTCVQ